jgi:hypothetical protein
MYMRVPTCTIGFLACFISIINEAGDSDAVAMLLEAGANRELLNKDGVQPWASASNPSIMELLSTVPGSGSGSQDRRDCP